MAHIPNITEGTKSEVGITDLYTEESYRDGVFENQVVEYQRLADVEDMLMPDISRILVIYTGGTIGMAHNKDNGYEPVKNYLTETLASQTRFHDPNGLFNSANNSVNNSRVNSYINLNSLTSPTFNKSIESESISKSLTPKEKLRWLITPPSLYGKRIKYAIKEYDPLLDSCNMTMSDWIKIASDIQDNYKKYDAFIILHGTDTMAYTASALSFMLEDLGKTVIITGSQVPISEVRNDAIENLLGALTVAGHFVIPEVCLYFGNKLFRGNRCSKVSAIDFDAFDSPNLRPLVNVGVNIDVNWTEILKPKEIAKFKAHKAMNPNVASLRLFPGITKETVKAFLSHSVEGVVLETFGAGNAPNRSDILDALKEASSRGVVIVNCTQCSKGSVSDLYATSKGLKAAGVVPGIDMTQECALTKLSYLLSKGYNPEIVRKLMKQNLRGELTGPYMTENEIINSCEDCTMETELCMIAEKLLHMELSDFSSSHGAPKSKVPFIASPSSIEKMIFPVLLCNAAGSNDLECMKFLLSSRPNHFNANCVDYEGRTPIHIASSLGHYEVANFLLLNGAALHLLDRSGHTPLYYAALHCHSNIIQLLLKDGAHFNSAELRKAKNTFIEAAAIGLTTKAQYFIEAGLNINSTNSDKRTALHLAVSNQRFSTIEFLLSCPEIQADIKDREGRTAIDEAQKNVILFNDSISHKILELLKTKFLV